MNVRLIEKVLQDLRWTMETAYPNRIINGDTCTIYCGINNDETKDFLVSYPDFVFENYFKDIDMFDDGSEFDMVVDEAIDFYYLSDDACVWDMEFTFKRKEVEL